jgi:hypothetical protein
MSGPKIGSQVDVSVREAEEAGASWGAPAEHKPQHAEIEVVTATPRTERRKIATHANIYEVAEQILEEVLEEVLEMEMARLSDPWSLVNVQTIKQLKNGLFYEVKTVNEDGWVERRVFRADKAVYYRKRVYIDFGYIVIPVEIEALDVAKTVYYSINVDREAVTEVGNELERLLKEEGVL